jgi:cytochrome c-type biogenesis protein
LQTGGVFPSPSIGAFTASISLQGFRSGGSVALALSAGIIAAFNPCGFAMLPAYMSYYVGTTTNTTLKEGETEPTFARRLLKATQVGATVALGFVTVFGVLGVLFSSLLSSIIDYVSYISMGVGVVLVGVGIAMLRGFAPKINALKISKSKSGSGLAAMYVYGLSYAVVSLSCGFAGFATTVVAASRTKSFLSSMLVYLSYSLGMALVLISLTIAVAFAQQAMVRGMRKILPYVDRVSGALLIIGGLYIAYYGYFEYRTIVRGDKVSEGPVGLVTDMSQRVTQLVDTFSTTTFVIIAVLLGVAVVGIAFRARSQRPVPEEVQ